MSHGKSPEASISAARGATLSHQRPDELADLALLVGERLVPHAADSSSPRILHEVGTIRAPQVRLSTVRSKAGGGRGAP
jgi:hypothetical protein